MNDFCYECTGEDTDDVNNCDDKNCPFYPYRHANLPYQEGIKDE